MKWFWDVVASVDEKLLLAARAAIQFVVEWLSVSRCLFERTLITLFVVSFAASIQMKGDLLRGWVIVPIFIGALLWMMQKDSDQVRVGRMLSSTYALVRIALIWTTLFTCALHLGLPPHRWRDLLMPIATTAYAAFYFAVSLPHSEQKGRRRRLATVKLKGLFGDSWTPTPEPSVS